MRVEGTTHAAAQHDIATVERAADMLVARLGANHQALQAVSTGARQEFMQVARTELRGLGLSSTELSQVYSIVRRATAIRS
jgi:hypothetical protein